MGSCRCKDNWRNVRGKQGGREIEPSVHLLVGSVGVLYYGKRATGHDQSRRNFDLWHVQCIRVGQGGLPTNWPSDGSADIQTVDWFNGSIKSRRAKARTRPRRKPEQLESQLPTLDTILTTYRLSSNSLVNHPCPDEKMNIDEGMSCRIDHLTVDQRAV